MIAEELIIRKIYVLEKRYFNELPLFAETKEESTVCKLT